ncbi:MAG TPA: sulfate adenylyltransferase [Nitrososphaerales archaeon]|nr:sulfate adenylyltransferase [Nitrososphaerales archaeon]
MASVPHGGKLVQIELMKGDSRDKAKDLSEAIKVKISFETRIQIFNISNGILSPLNGFMGSEDCQNVIDNMRLANDTPWTIPVLLHVPEEFAAGNGDEITLVDESDTPVAQLVFEELYKINKREYAMKVFGTEEEAHPGVAKTYAASDRILAGKLKAVTKYENNAFENYTLVPKETRVLFKEKGWKDVIAFQTRNAPHIGHEYVQKTALAFADGIFINPVLGKKKAGDFKDDVILAAYQALVKNYYPKNSAVLSVLNYEMQYAGPKEAIMHAIMRKNFGCTHIAIGRDHAGVGNYYGPYAAHEIFKEFPDLGISAIFFREFFYCTKCSGIANEKICPHPESDRLTFSGTKLRKMFLSGEVPPKEFMRPEVSEVILNSKSAFVE